MTKTHLPGPPTRGTAEPAFTPEKSTELRHVHVRVSAEHARYLRILAATTGEKQRELIEQAIDLLRKERGDV